MLADPALRLRVVLVMVLEIPGLSPMVALGRRLFDADVVADFAFARRASSFGTNSVISGGHAMRRSGCGICFGRNGAKRRKLSYQSVDQ